MSEEEKYTTVSVDLSGLDEAQVFAVELLMHEGALRERERIIKIIDEHTSRIDGFEGPDDIPIRDEIVLTATELKNLIDPPTR